MEKLKFVGGALIVLAAVAVAFPGFLSLAAGIGRIMFILVVVGGGCLLTAHLTRRIMKLGRDSGKKLSTGTAQPAELSNMNSVDIESANSGDSNQTQTGA